MPTPAPTLPATDKPLRRVLLTLLAFIGLGAGSLGCTTDQQVIAQASDVHQQLEPTVVTDPKLDAYVQAVGDRIVAAARQYHAENDNYDVEPWMFENIEFHLVASPTLNAFTTGGTHIYLYSQLFEESETEDAFAAVVGHEFGHIVGRHVQQSMDRQMGILAAAGVAGLAGAALAEEGERMQTGGTVGALALAGGQLFGMGFGRENEREADELGFQYHLRAGYDPKRFPDFFETMIAQGYDTPGGMQGYLSSHPRLAERVEAAERRAAAVPPEVVQRYNQPPVASPQEFAALKQLSNKYTQAAASQAQNSEAFAQAKAILDAFPRCVGGPDEVDAEAQP